MKQQIQELWKLIETSSKVLLINHIRMDGDAWGSLGGLALILKSMWKDVKAINDCPVPSSLQFLWYNDLIEPELDVKAYNPDIIISLDASDTGRLWETYITWKEVFDDKTLIVIDHHISNPAFWDVNIIDSEASSVCEIIVQIIIELKLQEYVSADAATMLYTGLQTDSNMYFNTNTRPSTLRAGATLMELGADFRAPIMQLYKKRTTNQLKLWQYAFSCLKYHFDDQVCGCILDYQWLSELWIDSDELSGYFKWLISELLINIEGVKIAYLIYPLDTSENKVSMRSQQWYNIAEICETFWGGWHKQAAGFQSEESSEIIEKKLIYKIQKTLNLN